MDKVRGVGTNGTSECHFDSTSEKACLNRRADIATSPTKAAGGLLDQAKHILSGSEGVSTSARKFIFHLSYPYPYPTHLNRNTLDTTSNNRVGVYPYPLHFL